MPRECWLNHFDSQHLSSVVICLFWHFTSKTLASYELCWHFWHRAASIVTLLTWNRPEVSDKHKGPPDKTKQYTQGDACRESPTSLVGFFSCQAFWALNSLHSLLSQEVCLTLSLGDDIWADSKSTGLITLAKYSGKYSALTHMRSINHLYNACHIKCKYDCGLQSMSAVLNLACVQDCLVALRLPPPPSIYLWGPYMPAGPCLNASLKSGSCARSLSWTSPAPAG